MTEEELLQNIRKSASLLGWLTYHTRDSRRSDSGFPDLVLTHSGRIEFWELKVRKRQLTLSQLAWKEALQWAMRFNREVEYRVIREEDWLNGTVERILKGGES